MQVRIVNPLTSDLQVHGHHPSAEAPPVGEGHHRGHRLYLESGRGSGLPSLLLLHHPCSASQDRLLRGLAAQCRRLLHVRGHNAAQFSPICLFG